MILYTKKYFLLEKFERSAIHLPPKLLRNFEVGVFLLEEDKNGVRLEWSRSVFCLYRNVICSCKTKDDNVCMKYRVKKGKNRKK